MIPGFKLYLVADGQSGDGSLEKALKAGVKAVQLREKGWPARKLLSLAQRVRELTRAHRAAFFINDRLDYLLFCNADGLHCPEAGLAPRLARLFLPAGKQIGKSVHSLEKALEAEKERADFIAFGPVFQTPSKNGILEPRGLEMLKKVAGTVTIPVYAIGGITPERAKECLKHGAYGVAVVSAILDAPDIPLAVSRFLEALA